MRLINDNYELIEGAGKLIYFPAKSLRCMLNEAISQMPVMGLIVKAPNLEFVDDYSHFLPSGLYDDNTLWTSSNSLGKQRRYQEILEIRSLLQAVKSEDRQCQYYTSSSKRNKELRFLRSLSDQKSSLHKKIKDSELQPCSILIEGNARWVWVHKDDARISQAESV